MDKNNIALCLDGYAKSDSVRLHMPGHKGRGDNCLQQVFARDITELSFSDNLSNASGVIKQAQEDIAFLTGAKASYILTGGSTLGVLSMVYAVKNRGSKMLVPRSSHKSVFNALELCGITPVILTEDLVNGLPTNYYLNEELFESADNQLIGALITSPDYFGRAFDLAKFANKLKKSGKLLLVDGAHGGHFAFDNKELYAGAYADIWVDGAHKTLHTLTQGAVLNLNDLSLKEGVERALDIFSTSSPSYPIMASVESGYKSFNQHKNKNLAEFNLAKNYLQQQIELLGYKVLKTDDSLKLTIDFNNLANGILAGEILESDNIFAELVSERYILFMFSYHFNLSDAKRVINSLKKVNKQKCGYKTPSFYLPNKKMEYGIARKQPTERVNIANALGRICAQNAGVFPPCYPVILAGEVFDNQVIQRLLVKNTFGVSGGVTVVKEKKDD